MPQPACDSTPTRPVSCGTSSATTGDTRADLWRRWRADRDVEARNALLIHHAPLVKWVANRIDLRSGAPVDRGDLFGWGMFGLIDAIESFEPELGYTFPTWAVRRIKGSIIDELRRVDHVSRGARARSQNIEVSTETLAQRLKRNPTHAELATEMGVDLDKLHAMLTEQADALQSGYDVQDANAPDPAASVEDHFERAFDRDLLRSAAAALPEQERTVIVLSYWEELTLAQIGSIIGVTKSRVCQIRSRALARLRLRLAQLATAS